ncbi:MAG: sigma-70 family RNA polymerase sigma factor [Clostridia bacterium]|nr:sigma-70 family RNA polymerase sigma factor [Clostridia bacterium]
MNDEVRNNFIDGLFREYYDDIVRYCTAMLDSDTADGELCAHEVFEQAYNDAHKLEKHPSISGWLYRTAKNRVRRLLREKEKRSKYEVHITDVSERYTDALRYIEIYDEEFAEEYDTELLKTQILDKLDDDERLLYEIRFTHKMTFKHIGKQVGLSESAARMRVVRLEFKLKMLVSEMFE